MRISAKAEYACVAMLELAANYREPQPLRIKTIAEAHGIDPRFLVQILLQLKTAGLVASVRGAAGGYKLTRPAERISLADVLNAVCREQATRSPTETPAPVVQALHSVWNEIQAQEQRILEALTLAELGRRARETSTLSYQI